MTKKDKHFITKYLIRLGYKSKCCDGLKYGYFSFNDFYVIVRENMFNLKFYYNKESVLGNIKQFNDDQR
jgi:hypothetical protein